MLPTSYVYHHRDPETAAIKYVGAGTAGRAWACGWSSKGGPRRGNRTELHQLWLNSLFERGYTMGDIVVIVVQGLHSSEALAIEREEILRYPVNQLFNIQTRKDCLVMKDSQLQLAIAMRADNKSYAKIARAIGVSTMTAHRALNDKTKGYLNASAN